ncbi:MAG: Wzz/FepE/Etk N-terminal domain-containing protein [Roseburia sp.]|nr:Wzz/FepE/Etk N-terminal domain-containing protein [Roseburia sp.]
MGLADRQSGTQPAEEIHEDKRQLPAHISVSGEEVEIDLLDLGLYLLEKIHYIILCFLAGAVLFNAFAYFLIKPTYQSTAKLYVVSASEDAIVNLSDLNIGSSLTSDYEELMLSYPVLDQVIDRLGLRMTYEKLAKMITLVNPKDTRMLNITVTSTSPQMACDIANTLANISVEYLPDTMSTRAPNVAQVARVADKKTDPSYLKYTIIGAFLGALVYCLILVTGYLLDDTIHTPEDMEKYFGIVPLTTIPESEQFRQEDESGRGTAKAGIGKESTEQESIRKGKH